MTRHTPNGWPVIETNKAPELRTWHIPGTAVRLRLANNYGGLALAVYATWYHYTVEPLNGQIVDDWGYANRLIRGSASAVSEHAAGMAMDLNAVKYPMGKRVRSALVRAKCRRRAAVQGDVYRLGQDFKTRVDDMHVEIKAMPMSELIRSQRVRLWYGWTQKILSANPGFCAEQHITFRYGKWAYRG